MVRPLRAAACAVLAVVAGVAGAARPPEDWRLLFRARAADHDRLRAWRSTWIEALAQARAAGEGTLIDREGALLQPDTALIPPDPPPGAYRCRTIRLGGPAAAAPVSRALPPATVVERPAVPCEVTATGLIVRGGVQRPAGHLYPWDGLRILFLGATAVGDEGGALPYGRDPDRSLVGFVDRYAPARWRLVMPQPAWGPQIEIVEMVPAGG